MVSGRLALTCPARPAPARSKQKGDSAPTAGWTCFVALIGSTSDLMVVHFRDSLDAIGAAASFDLIAAFAGPLPTIVIAEMLGVDRRVAIGTARIFARPKPVRSRPA